VSRQHLENRDLSVSLPAPGSGDERSFRLEETLSPSDQIVRRLQALGGVQEALLSGTNGEVGKKWTLLTLLLVFFFIGYLASPLLLFFQLDPRYVNLLVFLVFLFGAAFVYVVVGIIRDILTFLDLLK
jgi:hypothetical protein